MTRCDYGTAYLYFTGILETYFEIGSFIYHKNAEILNNTTGASVGIIEN